MREMPGGPDRRIVVGVDGSESSMAALRWAVGHAKGFNAVVEAVIAWEFPATYGWVPTPPEEWNFEKIAKEKLAETLELALPHGGHVGVRSYVRKGHPAGVLVDFSRGAELLVVGSRGHGGFAGVLLGSVSQHCVTHAACPVLVIRGAST
ncbi:universal stress protein [Streptomyces sp. NBC_00631]|uniref:universal stress protein n=1 Tax=Streptomyces sp. NBC_00631 TaxID=2975793 RepID=UPI0030E33D73